jgi:hypothetical protein
MIIDFLRQEHRNIEKLLLVLEHELSLFVRGERPDYEVIRAVIAYFEVYPDVYHHPQEDIVFKRLKARDPAAAESVGDLAADHRSGAERLRRASSPRSTNGSGDPTANGRRHYSRLHRTRTAARGHRRARLLSGCDHVALAPEAVRAFLGGGESAPPGVAPLSAGNIAAREKESLVAVFWPK